MSKYIQLSRYYFSDKDLADVLGDPAFSERTLLHLGRQRGFFFSPLEKKKQLVHLLSHVPFDWDGLKDLAERLNSDERDKKRSTRRFENFGDLDAVNKALNELKTERGTKEQEVYNIQKKSQNVYQVDVAYIDIDTSKARAFQRTEAHSTIEFEKVDNRIEVRFSHDERSREVIQALFDKLKASLNKELKALDIELTGIRDPALRSQFFINLRQKLKDFRPIDVLDLSFDRRLPEEAATEESVEDESEETEETAEIKTLVRKAAFSGQGLLSSELTNKLRETGYFISRIKWSAKETKGDERLSEIVILPSEWFRLIEKMCKNTKVIKAHISDMALSNLTAASLTLAGSEDVRKYFRKITLGIPHNLDSVQIECKDGEEFIKFEVNAAARVKLISNNENYCEPFFRDCLAKLKQRLKQQD